MLQHYIKTAFRHLLKYKTQNLISILGLSVGILCFSICLYCSRFIYSVDQCFTNKERIANVNLYTPDGDIYSGIPANLIESLRQTPVDEAEDYTFVGYPRLWGIERSGFFNGREKWAKGFENQRV